LSIAQEIGEKCLKHWKDEQNFEKIDPGGGTKHFRGRIGGLKTRELARDIGVANGAVYNLVEDMDELILRVGSRTLARLDAALSAAEAQGPTSPRDTLVRIAVAYCDFAAENLELWRALFEHRMAPGKPVPEWAVDEQMNLFRHIYHPLAALFPKRTTAELGVTARSLFSAVHGMVLLGLGAEADRGAGD
jgi:AcrR family transcriptional regulator